MTRLYLLLSAGLLLCTCVRAQNDFQLFRPGVQYLYENPEFQSPAYGFETEFYGVRVDSLGCQELYGSLQSEYAANGAYCVSRVPSPFGYTVCQTADSTVMDFGAGDRLAIYQTAEVGTRWIARDSAGVLTFGEVLGQLLGNDTATVLGYRDELKTIGFFTEAEKLVGPPIVISRQYGLVEGTRFYQLGKETEPLRLAGMSAPVAGVQRPMAESLGAAQVGDRFHLETTTVGYNPYPVPGGSYFQHEFETAEVIGVDTLAGDTIDYTLRSDVLTFRSPGRSTDGGRDSVLVRDSIYHHPFIPPPALLTDLQPGARTPGDSAGSTDIVRLVKLYRQPCGLLSTRFSTEAVYTGEDPCGLDGAMVDGVPGDAYTPYIPLNLDSIDFQTGVYYKTLRYAQTADLECGTPLDLSDIIIATDDFSAALDAAIQVYPNPATDLLTVLLPSITEAYSLEVYSLIGRRLREIPAVRERATLNVQELPAGTYLLLILTDGRTVGRKRFTVF